MYHLPNIYYKQWYIFSEEDYFESEFEYKSNPSLEDNSDNNKIVIEHLTSTSRELVGLQVSVSIHLDVSHIDPAKSMTRILTANDVEKFAYGICIVNGSGKAPHIYKL